MNFSRDSSGLIRGAGVLVGAAFLVKGMGGILRIPLTRMMGPEGMGLYQMAYSIYGLMISVFVSGFPLAVSRMIAEARAHRTSPGAVLRAALILLLLTGLLGSLALYLGAGFLAASVIGDPRAAAPIRAIAPALVIVSCMAALRGYNQGLGRMEPTALSQLLEQLVRVLTALALAGACLPLGLERASQGAALGTTAGATAGLIVLVLMTKVSRSGREQRGTSRLLAARTVGLAVPTSLAALLLPALDALNAILLPRRLIQAGLEPQVATALYGQLAGVALPLMGLPAVISISLAAALVPRLTESSSRGRASVTAGNALTAIRLTVYTALPASAGVMAMARPLGETVFALPEVTPLIAIVAPGCLFLAVQQTTTGVLLGLGRPLVPAGGLLLALGLTGAIVHGLSPIPGWGIFASAAGLALGLALAAIWNVYFVARSLPLPLPGEVLRLFMVSVFMGLTVYLIYPLMAGSLGEWLGVAVAVVTGSLLYGLSTLSLLMKWLKG